MVSSSSALLALLIYVSKNSSFPYFFVAFVHENLHWWQFGFDWGNVGDYCSHLGLVGKYSDYLLARYECPGTRGFMSYWHDEQGVDLNANRIFDLVNYLGQWWWNRGWWRHYWWRGWWWSMNDNYHHHCCISHHCHVFATAANARISPTSTIMLPVLLPCPLQPTFCCYHYSHHHHCHYQFAIDAGTTVTRGVRCIEFDYLSLGLWTCIEPSVSKMVFVSWSVITRIELNCIVQ